MRVSLIILLASSIALAGERPKLVVVPFSVGEGASDSAAAKFSRLLTEELKTRDDVVEIIAAPTTKAAPAPEKPAPSGPAKKTTPSPEALAALETGKKALADLKFDEAIGSLKKGIDLSLADPATADYPAVLEAYISLGVAAFRQGDEKEANAALFHLARLDPNYQLPPGFPPIFGREFEKAKKKVEKQAKGSVSVEGPSASTAFVDGRDLGMVPVLEENLAPGPHYVKVEGSKGERFGQTVDIKGTVAKVRATFSGGSSKEAPAVVATGGIANPSIGSRLDDNTAARLAVYVKAAYADYAVVGIVYRTGDQQLTAGTALYSARKQGFASLPPIGFDSDVLTANVEAYKLADAVQEKINSFTFSSLPINLVTKAFKAGTASSGNSSVGDVAAVTPDRKASKPKGDAEKTDLTPKGEVRALDKKSNLVDAEKPPDEPPPAEVKSGGVPVWVLVVAGVAVAAGAGVGGYFTYKEVSKPVTGTVTATW